MSRRVQLLLGGMVVLAACSSGRVFDLSDGRLVWAGQSETMNPDSLDDSVRSVVKPAAREMTRAGVLADAA